MRYERQNAMEFAANLRVGQLSTRFKSWGCVQVSRRLHLRQSEREGDLVRGEDICVVQDTSLVRKRMADDGLLRTLRRYMAVALMQILRPSQTMYMPTWQVEFVELQPLS